MNELEHLRDRLSALRSLADAAGEDGCRPVSFPALCDSIDSKDTEEHVYSLVMHHVRRRERAEAALAALRSRLSDLTAALVTTEKARDRWHQKYIVEAQARQDEVKILGAELAEERRRHEPPFDAASQNQAPDAVG